MVRNCAFLILCLLLVTSCANVQSTILETSVTVDQTEGIQPTISSAVDLNTPTLPPTKVLKDLITSTSAPVPSTSVREEILIPEDSLLIGPLVGFRGYDSQGDLLAILDLSNNSTRIIRSDIDHPFGKLWFNSGCEIITANGTVDLHGSTVWQRPSLDWDILLPDEGAYSKINLVSPDRQWLAYDILYGEQFFESTEFSDLGIVSLTDPSNPVFLTTDGRANTFAWSTDSAWIAYKHVDENGFPQLFRSSPDGRNLEQLTFHTERVGIGYIVWSPDGRYIAYAGYQSKDDGETGIGWVDILDTQTLHLYRALPTTDDFGGVHQNEIWWSLDGTQLVFSGRNWQNSADTTQIYWIDVQNSSIIDSYFASAVPEGRIEEVYAVSSVDQILFGTNGNFYLLNVIDKSYRQIPFNTGAIGQRYDSESAPFDFPGEKNCHN